MPSSLTAAAEALLAADLDPSVTPLVAAAQSHLRAVLSGTPHGRDVALARAARGDTPGEAESEAIFRELLSGDLGEGVAAALLLVLRPTTLAAPTLAGFARVLRDAAIPVRPRLPAGTMIADTCGTGSDGVGTFNVSTTVMFLLAAAGIRVAKHGNRGVTSRCGSADVLEALGVAIDLDAKGVAACIEEAGVGFMFAPKFHPAMAAVQPLRRRLAEEAPPALRGPTVFNVLGPLANPARATRQVIGVYDPALVPTVAEVARRLGLERALVVHGAGGLDEVSTLGPTLVAELQAGEVTSREVTPEQADVPRVADVTVFAGGDAARNAEITRAILSGDDVGPRASLVFLNAAAGLYCCDRVGSLAAGVTEARRLVASGAAREALDTLRETSVALRGSSV